MACSPQQLEHARRYRQRNPDKVNAYHRAWYEQNRSRTARYRLKTRLRVLYGLTLEEYEALMTDAERRCEVCGQENRLVVDHDHKTGAVRGILCRACNLALGAAQDDPGTLRTLAGYLEERGRRWDQ